MNRSQFHALAALGTPGCPAMATEAHAAQSPYIDSRYAAAGSVSVACIAEVGPRTRNQDKVTGNPVLGPGVVGLIPFGWEDDHDEEKAAYA